MAHIIDSLLIEIGIDPTRFSKDYKNYLARLNEVKDTTKKQATGIEEHGKKIGETFGAITRRLLGLTAVFVGARGVVDFVAKITSADTAIGRLSQRVGVGVNALSNWQTAGALMGGTAEGMANVFEHLNQNIQHFKYFGESELFPLFNSLASAGGHVIDMTKPLNEQLMAISANLEQVSKTDPRGALYVARLLGADEATAAAMVRGPRALQEYIDKARALGEVTDKDVAAAKSLWETWNSLTTVSISLGRALATSITSYVKPVGDWLVEKIAAQYHAVRREGPLGAVKEDPLVKIFSGSSWDEAFGTTRWKTGQKGNIQPGTEMLAAMIQGAIPDLNQFTAGNDPFHQGTKSLHNKGLALDFTLTGGNADKYKETVKKLQALYGSDASFGFHPTGHAGSTADHIHASFASEAAAAKFGSQHNETVNISTVNINVGSGDPEKIKDALRPQRLAAQANTN